MRALSIVAVVAMLVACGPTDNQVKLAEYYYNAKVLQQAQSAQPLVRITPAKEGEPIILTNVKALEIYQPVREDAGIQQYQERDYAAPWIGVAQTLMSVGIPWLGAWGIVDSIAKIPQGTTYNNAMNGNNNKFTGTSYSNASVNGNSNTLAGGDVTNTTTTTTSTKTITETVNQADMNNSVTDTVP